MSASDLPLSVLIVGVGGADFKQMEVLYIYIYFMVRPIDMLVHMSFMFVDKVVSYL